jgi:hypothetical protein
MGENSENKKEKSEGKKYLIAKESLEAKTTSTNEKKGKAPPSED